MTELKLIKHDKQVQIMYQDNIYVSSHTTENLIRSSERFKTKVSIDFFLDVIPYMYNIFSNVV